MGQDLFLKMIGTSEDEINAIADTGMFNGIIKGYLVATLKHLHYKQEDISDAIDALTDILDNVNAEEARKHFD